MYPELFFDVNFPKVPTPCCLVRSKLILRTSGREVPYTATSGCKGCQHPSFFWAKGRGPIPPNKNGYTVTTTPINLTNVKGIEGNFYQIHPFTVSHNGKQRGDFGIHLDANVPGSAGCIVIVSQVDFNSFELEMKILAKKGIRSVPLVLSYQNHALAGN